MACCAGMASARGLKGKTIYLNPGHGGYTTGDRPTATINYEYMDTMSFYETRSNLWKALETAKHLKHDGAKVIMSRTKCGIVTKEQMEKGILNENSEVTPATDVIYFEHNGYQCAKLNVVYTLKSGTVYQTTKEVYILRKDEQGHWKIFGFTLAEE